MNGFACLIFAVGARHFSDGVCAVLEPCQHVDAIAQEDRAQPDRGR